MTALTGACERPWPIALSRSSRVTTPTSCARLADLDPALAVALAERHRVRDGVVGRDEPRRARHDLARPSAARGSRSASASSASVARLGERPVEGRRRGLRVPSAAERAAATARRRRTRASRLRTTQTTRASISTRQTSAPAFGEVDELVREARDPVDVDRPGERATSSTSTPADGDGLDRGERARRGARAPRRRAARAGSARPSPAGRRGVGTRRAPRRRAASPSGRSASPCPRGSRARRPSPRAA